MILIGLIVIPLLAAPLAWWGERQKPGSGFWIAAAAMVLDGVLLAQPLLQPSATGTLTTGHEWMLRWQADWIPQLGIQLQLALDGLSLILVTLTLILSLFALMVARQDIHAHSGQYYFHSLLATTGMIGVFLALDLFLFFLFWELMLIPMYFIISIWGHANRAYSAMKFFIFTQASGLLMLFAILALVWQHASLHGAITFDYFRLLDTQLHQDTAYWLMLGFFIAFAVKLPIVPFHTWLPDAHTDAPTGGSVLLAGILLKTGGYGLIRFVMPLFPEAAEAFAPTAMWLGAIGVIYGAVLAFAQTDFKRLVAYSSVSHMGFVLLGVFALNAYATQGAIIQMLAHGLSTGALFILAGALQHRLHTRDLQRMGGLWQPLPRAGALTLFFAVASLGLPGLGNFVGEFMVLLGAFQQHVWITAVAAIGIVFAAIYSLSLVQRSFHGEPTLSTHPATATVSDLGLWEMSMLIALAVLLVIVGLYPQPLIDLFDPIVRTTTAAIDNVGLNPMERAV